MPPVPGNHPWFSMLKGRLPDDQVSPAYVTGMVGVGETEAGSEVTFQVHVLG